MKGPGCHQKGSLSTGPPQTLRILSFLLDQLTSHFNISPILMQEGIDESSGVFRSLGLANPYPPRGLVPFLAQVRHLPSLNGPGTPLRGVSEPMSSLHLYDLLQVSEALRNRKSKQFDRIFRAASGVVTHRTGCHAPDTESLAKPAVNLSFGRRVSRVAPTAVATRPAEYTQGSLRRNSRGTATSAGSV